MRVLLAVAIVALGVSSSAAAAAVDPRAPRQAHTAADTKRANAIVLRRSDLAAGWKLDPAAKSNAPCTAGPDESSLVQTAKVDPSFTYKDGVTNIGSEVDIFKTTADARKDWRASTRALLQTCLLWSARGGAGKKLHVRIVSTSTLAAPKGAERSLHYRFVLGFRTTKSANLVIDVVALGRGRLTVVLHTLTVRTALPAATLDALTGVLASRLNAGLGPTA
jgi:hypothetical protein